MSSDIKHLCTDPILASIYSEVLIHFGELPTIAPAEPEKYFESLCESIVSQQLSVKVADIIFARLKQLVGNDFNPDCVLAIKHEKLREVGLSNAKASYIHNIAEAWTSGLVSSEMLATMDEEELISHLVQIKGVGRWTAEMFLLFTIGRPDIFSLGDYGLKKAVSFAYNISITSKPNVFLEISQQWSPYRSLASRILWKSLEFPRS